MMDGRNYLTYRYIMFTTLLAKAVDTAIDVLSLQAGDRSADADDARSLASKAVYPFQKSMLGNILDGSNNDPLVNKPERSTLCAKPTPPPAATRNARPWPSATTCRKSKPKPKPASASTTSRQNC